MPIYQASTTSSRQSLAWPPLHPQGWYSNRIDRLVPHGGLCLVIGGSSFSFDKLLARSCTTLGGVHLLNHAPDPPAPAPVAFWPSHLDQRSEGSRIDGKKKQTSLKSLNFAISETANRLVVAVETDRAIDNTWPLKSTATEAHSKESEN